MKRLWSENYTRDLKDVFAVQTELAQTIVGAVEWAAHGWRGESDGQGGRFRPKCTRRKKAERKLWRRTSITCRAVFIVNRHSEKGTNQALADYRTRGAVGSCDSRSPGQGSAEPHIWYCEFSTRRRTNGLQRPVDGRARGKCDKALTIEPRPAGGACARRGNQSNFDYDWNGAAKPYRRLSLGPARSGDC